MNNSALLIVDLENDFITGSLPVPNAQEVVNKIDNLCKQIDIPIYLTLDFHPYNHCSFKENGGMWPSHCVMGTEGTVVPISVPFVQAFIKGTDLEADSYSAVRDANGNLNDNNILEALRQYDTVYVCGLAFDFCVKSTAIDLAKELGSSIIILKELTASVFPENDNNIASECLNAGVKIDLGLSSRLLNNLKP